MNHYNNQYRHSNGFGYNNNGNNGSTHSWKDTEASGFRNGGDGSFNNTGLTGSYRNNNHYLANTNRIPEMDFGKSNCGSLNPSQIHDLCNPETRNWLDSQDQQLHSNYAILRLEQKVDAMACALSDQKKKYKTLQDNFEVFQGLLFEVIQDQVNRGGRGGQNPGLDKYLDLENATNRTGSRQKNKWENLAAKSVGPTSTASYISKNNNQKRFSKGGKINNLSSPASRPGNGSKYKLTKRSNSANARPHGHAPTPNKCVKCEEGLAWKCNACLNMNYPWRQWCNMRNCQTPKPAFHAHQRMEKSKVNKKQARNIDVSKKSSSSSEKETCSLDTNSELDSQKDNGTSITRSSYSKSSAPRGRSSETSNDNGFNCQMCAVGFCWKCGTCGSTVDSDLQVCDFNGCNTIKPMIHGHTVEDAADDGHGGDNSTISRSDMVNSEEEKRIQNQGEVETGSSNQTSSSQDESQLDLQKKDRWSYPESDRIVGVSCAEAITKNKTNGRSAEMLQ